MNDLTVLRFSSAVIHLFGVALRPSPDQRVAILGRRAERDHNRACRLSPRDAALGVLPCKIASIFETKWFPYTHSVYHIRVCCRISGGTRPLHGVLSPEASGTAIHVSGSSDASTHIHSFYRQLILSSVIGMFNAQRIICLLNLAFRNRAPHDLRPRRRDEVRFSGRRRTVHDLGNPDGMAHQRAIRTSSGLLRLRA